MKKVLLLASAVTALSLSLVSCDGMGVGKTKINLEDPKHEVSYMIGRDIGRSLKNMDTELDVQVIYAAIREVLDDVPAKLSDSALADINKRLIQDLRTKAEEKRQKEMEQNKANGEIFLAANKEVPGVIVTESGLQYQVITEGTGEIPTLNDRVRVHYHGTLLDGTVFDSSVDRGEPASFGVGQVIRGWTEALQLMKVGSKIKAFIPSDLAYGERGARAPVGPNQTLIFEIELLEIIK